MESDDLRDEEGPVGDFVLAGVDEVITVDADVLLDLVGPLGRFAEPIRDIALVNLLGHADAPLEVRVGKWSCNATLAVVQSAISTAVLLPICHFTGTEGIPLVVVGAVLPYLVNVTKIEVKDSDLHVLAEFRDRVFIDGDAEHAYGRLPADIRHEITLLEFRDLLQRLVSAGHLDRNGSGHYQLTERAVREISERVD